MSALGDEALEGNGREESSPDTWRSPQSDVAPRAPDSVPPSIPKAGKVPHFSDSGLIPRVEPPDEPTRPRLWSVPPAVAPIDDTAPELLSSPLWSMSEVLNDVPPTRRPSELPAAPPPSVRPALVSPVETPMPASTPPASFAPLSAPTSLGLRSARDSVRSSSRGGIAPSSASELAARSLRLFPSMLRPSEALLSITPALLERTRTAFDAFARASDSAESAQLERALELRSIFLAERALAVPESQRAALIHRFERAEGVPRLLFRSTLDKLVFAFHLHDLDSDGVVTRAELACALELGLSEGGSLPEPRVVQRLSKLLFGFGISDDGLLSFREFEALASQRPEWTSGIPRPEATPASSPQEELARLQERAPASAPGAAPAVRASLGVRALRYVASNPALVLVAIAWALGNALLFTNAVLKYQALGKNGFIQLARGCGACINLNGALIALPMARRTLTWARRVPGLRWLPLDDSDAIHRTLGISLLVLSVVHTAAHCASWAKTTPSVWGSMTGCSAGITGLALLVVFFVMWFFSRRKVRGSKRFELFSRTHLLYPLWFGLAIAHGPAFLMWAGVPLAIFAVDRVMRLRRSGTPALVHGCQPLVSGVTRLTIEKPANFTHRAGDYVLLKIPEVAPKEWHPFTISSAPEQEHLTLHVRNLGDFTGDLYEFARARSSVESPPLLRVCLDGPFGTSSQRIFEGKNVVMIGAGIGVTPFASVLESIVMRQASDLPFEKVYFYWLNRDEASFKWFASLLSAVERGVAKKLVDVRMFKTGDHRASSTSSTTVPKLTHGTAPDASTREQLLRSMMRSGRPHWQKELSAIAAAHPNTAQVFFCGPEGLARAVRGVCAELRLPFHQEHF